MTKKIRQISIYRMNLAGNAARESQASSEYLMSTAYTDENGQETERISYNADGESEERVLTLWENGHPVEERIELSGEPAERTTREFDDDGKIVREFRHYLDGEPDEIFYEYDAKGRLLKRQVTDSDGEEGEMHRWEYIDDQLVREEATNEYGDLEFTKNYTYHENGKPEELTELSFAGGEQTRNVNLYDEEGRLETEKRYNSKGQLIARNTYTYDEKGNATEITEETVTGTSLIKMQHDDKGNPVLQEEYDKEGSLITRIERTYDEEGRQLSTEVRMESTAQRFGQHYRLRFDYLFSE